MHLFFVRKLAEKLGVDKAIAYSSGGRVVSGLAGVLSVFFISTFLTEVEQGFYFTFGSILAIQVFFELGLTGIMTQFVAHEASHLTLNEELEYEGNEYYKSRLASLVHFCMKWYTVLAIIVFFSLLFIGHIYFNRYGSEHTDVNWRTPWLLICVGTAIKLWQSPFNSILLGLGKVKEMSKISFWQQLIQPLSVWIGLAVGANLYVMGIGYLLSVIIWQLFIYREGLERIIINLWKVSVSDKVSYLREIFPFQWKIALSWVSGYFIFQLYNPVLFATEGAIVAGQMGMTLTALNAIQTFSFSWLNTKVPHYSGLIALKRYDELDSLFNKTLKQMTFVCVVMLSAFFAFLVFLNISKLSFNGNVLADRFLGYFQVILLMLPVVVRQYVNSWATYLRCHKQEPYLVYSLVGGILSCAFILVFGNLYGLNGIVISSCLQCILLSPWGYFIYKNKKTDWHGKND